MREAEIKEGKFVTLQRQKIGSDLPITSDSSNFKYLQSAIVKNSTTTATVMQLECMNNLKRITERKSAYIFHDPSKQSF